MKFEEQSRSVSDDENKVADKEIQINDQNTNFDKISEESNIEREKNSPEKQNIENPEIEQQIKNLIDTISDYGILKVYDKSGKFIFTGNPEQLIIFWKNKDYGTITDIGGISDEEGKSILRFGSVDDYGFINRKRIEGLFQQLENRVVSKKRIAEDAQKLIELREQIGIKQQIPVTPQVVEQSAEILNKPSEQIETKIESDLDRQNLFNEQKAKQIVDVAKDLVKYGGTLYGHITGKDPKFEKGVDYKMNPDGSIEMESYRQALHKKAEEWWNNPGNKKWFDDFEQFHNKHLGDDLSLEAKKVKVKQSDGSFVEKNRWTTPFLYQDGWLYYESNYFDEQKGEFRQPEREKTQYRVYFDVEGADIMPTFSELIDELNQDPELKKLGFQIKTAQAMLDSNKEEEKKVEMDKMAMTFMNQRDRIVLYLGNKGIERALPILKKYAEKNKQKFNREGILLAQELTDSNGEKISGISITSETKGKSPDTTQFAGEYKSFNDMQANIIESSFRSIITALKNPKTLEMISGKYPKIKEGLANLPANASQANYLRVILADPNGEEFLIKNLQNVYPQWSRAFGMKYNNIAFKER